MNLKKYIQFNYGNNPIILSCPHGGFLKPTFIPNKLVGSNLADKNKYLITKWIIKELLKKNIKPYYILSKIHRSKIDFNRPARSHVAFNHNSSEAKELHNTYHHIIEEFYKECLSLYNKCLFLDLHGFTKPNKNYPDIIFGHLFGKTLKLKDNLNPKKTDKYWIFSDLVQEFSKYFSLDDGLGINDFNLAYSGGYITHCFYKKYNVNAIQIEVAKYIRENIKLTKLFINIFVNVLTKCVQK